MPTPEAPLLTQRALNRATLARQLLLRRVSMPPLEAVTHLAGMQAQTTHTWYVGLWSRLEGFEAESLSALLRDREVVRIALMRSTIHLVSAEDCLEWRPLVAGPMERGYTGNFAKHLVGVDLDAVVEAGRALVEEQPRTFDALGKLLKERWPDRDAMSLAQLVRARLALVQVPPRGLWGKSGLAAHTTAEAWLGRDLEPAPRLEAIVRRYLAALGPASVLDAQNWSGITRLRDVFEELRPQLLTFRDEAGRELFDLPEASRPDPSTPAPVRYLYDYDNLLLGHADRSRFMDPRYPQTDLWSENGPPNGAFLVGGVVRGSWRVEREGRGKNGASRLDVRSMHPLPKSAQAALAKEGERLLAFLTPEVPSERRTIDFGWPGKTLD